MTRINLIHYHKVIFLLIFSFVIRCRLEILALSRTFPKLTALAFLLKSRFSIRIQLLYTNSDLTMVFPIIWIPLYMDTFAYLILLN